MKHIWSQLSDGLLDEALARGGVLDPRNPIRFQWRCKHTAV